MHFSTVQKPDLKYFSFFLVNAIEWFIKYAKYHWQFAFIIVVLDIFIIKCMHFCN